MTDTETGRMGDLSNARRRIRPGDQRLRADPSMSKQQRRTVRAVANQTNRILVADEEVLAVSDAIEDAGWATRTVLGALWAPSRRVTLLFTSRRLIEIGMSATGRRAVGRIRSFPWDGIPSFRFVDDVLEVRTWESDVIRWYLRDVPDPGVEGRLNRRVNLAVSTFVPSQSRTAPLLHCSHCGAERPASEDHCRHCDATVRTPRRASQLALALPGGGHFYAQRPIAGVTRVVLEFAVFAALAANILITTELWRELAIVAIGGGLLAVVKLHGAWSARLLAARAGAITSDGEKWWRRLVPLGFTLSVVALLAPLPWSGTLEGLVSWDLAFADSTNTWTGGPSRVTNSLPGLRSVWIHDQGQEVSVFAWPFAPFETDRRARQRIADEWGIKGVPQPVGAFEIQRAVQVEAGSDGAVHVITLLIVDSNARDVHALSTTVPGGDSQPAAERMDELLKRAYWVRPLQTDR